MSQRRLEQRCASCYCPRPTGYATPDISGLQCDHAGRPARVRDDGAVFHRDFGNAASTGHAFGEQAHDAVDAARRTIAEAINAQPDEIIFTSGATESDNLAIKGTARRHEG